MDETNTTIIVGAIVGGLALVAVILRFYVRYSRNAGFSWDDWLILFSLLDVIAIDAADLYATSFNPNGAAAASSNGAIEYTPADVTYTKITFTSTVLYFTLTSTTKLSILFLYNRLFSVNTSFRPRVIALGIVVLGFWIGTVVSDLLNCIPLEWTWLNSLDDPRYCFNYNYYWLATGVVEAVIDIAIILLPIPIIVRLRLNRGKKFGIAGVFLVGIFVIVSGIVKVILSYAPNSREPSFSQTQVWTTVHSCTGIVCACLPVCWPLLKFLGKLHPSSWFASTVTRKNWYGLSAWSSQERRVLHHLDHRNRAGERIGSISGDRHYELSPV
ncbi:putative integral membrane protein [Rosellinia necatrix]|uniref:Putative integral membrane protein n=1 Tax=Rosellinia necatrix TaxID=77044 RepID=A0A1W2TSL4_ROSNE|nr:putative integral membrane protein [Rosellinia necatrix]